MIGKIMIGLATTIFLQAGGPKEVAKGIAEHMPTQQEVNQAAANARNKIHSSSANSKQIIAKHAEHQSGQKPAFAIREIGDDSPAASMQLAAAPVTRCHHNVGGTMDMYGNLTCSR